MSQYALTRSATDVVPLTHPLELPTGIGDSRDAAIWAVMPARAQTVVVFGDARLRQLIGGEVRCRFEPAVRRAEPAEALPADATVAMVLGRVPTASELDEAMSWLGDSGTLAIAIQGREIKEPDGSGRASVARLKLGAVKPAATTAAATRRVTAHLARRGFEILRVPTGDRSRRHLVGLAEPLGRHGRLTHGYMVLAWRGSRPATVIEQAVAEASAAAGSELRIGRATGLPSGILHVELFGSPPSRYLLRLGNGRALADSRRALELLAASNPPPALRDRIPWAVIAGRAGPAAFTLEPWLAGAHPRRLTSALWRETLDFLVELHATGAPPVETMAQTPSPGGSIRVDVGCLLPHVASDARPVLERVSRSVEQRLEPVPTGWAHGDFWPGNILAREDRLLGVVDWDGAGPSRLAALDAMHLIVMSEPSLRRMPHGARCSQWLWPLARAGGGECIQAYCAATSTPTDPATLEALAVAYWLQRVARDVRGFVDRLSRPRWLDANLHSPLNELRAARW